MAVDLYDPRSAAAPLPSRPPTAMQAMALDDLWRLAGAIARGGLFKVSSPEEALTRLIVAQEVGMTVMEAMTDITVISGRPSFNGRWLASKVTDHPRADFQVIETTATRCEIAWFRDGVEVGRTIWDEARAKQAGLWKKSGPWSTDPTAMLRWRCVGEGVRIYVPFVVSATIYVEGEIPDPVGAPESGPVAVGGRAEQPSGGPVLSVEQEWRKAAKTLDRDQLAIIGRIAKQAGGILALAAGREPGEQTVRELLLVHPLRLAQPAIEGEIV